MKKPRRFSDPDDIDHDELRRLAYLATQVAFLSEALDLLDDAYRKELEEAEARGLDDDAMSEGPVADAFGIVNMVYEELDRYLEGEVMVWLAKDPEHWPIFRLMILDPWRKKSGELRKNRPSWVTTLTTNTVIAHFQQDPFGRKQAMGTWLFPQSNEDDA